MTARSPAPEHPTLNPADYPTLGAELVDHINRTVNPADRKSIADGVANAGPMTAETARELAPIFGPDAPMAARAGEVA